MLVSFVLRLRSEDLERGLITGRVEHVASGHQQGFEDLADLADFCLGIAAVQPDIPQPRGLETTKESDPA